MRVNDPGSEKKVKKLKTINTSTVPVQPNQLVGVTRATRYVSVPSREEEMHQ
jgi:hypothetical protein